MQDENGPHTFGWRDLLGAVNLGDFSEMVRGELTMVGDAFTLALESLRHPPLGPLIAIAGLLLLLLRVILLALVVIVFGTGIVLISAVRAIGRLLGRSSSPP